jgi:phosphoglucosamine mutase
MPKYFGTDGIRGKSPEWLNDKMAYAIGYGLGHGLKVKKLLVARDTRASGVNLKDALISGALSQNIDVNDLGIISTPMLAYLTITEDCFGVMITASHNPASDNGIKVIEKGKKITEFQEEILENYLGLNLETANLKIVTEDQTLVSKYLDALQKLNIPKSNLKVVLDTANGALSPWAVKILSNYVDVIGKVGDNPNGSNINQNVGSTHLEALIKATPKGAVGFAFDGDGDRLLCVDENGNVVTGDRILGIMGKHYLNTSAQIVFTQMLNPGIKHSLSQNGIQSIETKVGDKYVMEALDEKGLSMGGEDSGHLIFKKFWPLGDGIVSALLIIKLMVESNQTLASLAHEFKPFPEILLNFKNIEASSIESNEFQTRFNNLKLPIEMDGKVLLRPSGTEPVVRLYASHAMQNQLDKFVLEATKLIESFGGSL